MEASAGLLKKAKTALRIKSNNEDIEDEIKDLIESCIADLQLAGVNTIDEKDPLIISAVKQYCKGYFGSSDKADEYKKAYESIKLSLSLSGKHTEVPVPPEEPKPPEITVGATVIVSGTIYTEIDSYEDGGMSITPTFGDALPETLDLSED